MRTIYLASKSYRRRVLLKPYFNLKTISVDLDERSLRGEKPKVYIKRIVKEKWTLAKARLSDRPTRPLITADTIVVLKDRILQKPTSRTSAKQMLQFLSGKTHQVITAVAVGKSSHLKPNKIILSSSSVRFRKILREELETYLDSGEWEGKAGAYGIQGKAYRFIANINGSLTSIVGLPLEETLEAIRGQA